MHTSAVSLPLGSFKGKLTKRKRDVRKLVKNLLQYDNSEWLKKDSYNSADLIILWVYSMAVKHSDGYTDIRPTPQL